MRDRPRLADLLDDGQGRDQVTGQREEIAQVGVAPGEVPLDVHAHPEPSVIDGFDPGHRRGELPLGSRLLPPPDDLVVSPLGHTLIGHGSVRTEACSQGPGVPVVGGLEVMG